MTRSQAIVCPNDDGSDGIAGLCPHVGPPRADAGSGGAGGCRLDRLADGATRPALVGLTLLVTAVLGFLPGASTVAGLLVAWLAVRMMLGHEAAALPRLVARRSIGVERLARVIGIAAPWLAWVERLVHPRRPALFQTTKPLTGIMMLLLGLSMGSPVPFSQVLPALVIMLLALAYLEEDGIALPVALIAALASLSPTGATLWGTVETIDWLDPS